ncbi:MAG: conjugative transposon protein TraM [Mangrovibacterium sp.]
MSDADFVASYGQGERNFGFITVDKLKEQATDNAIRECVYQTISLRDGMEVRLRLLQDIRVGDVLVARNTILTGAASVAGERL